MMSKMLLLIGAVCLGLYGYFSIEAYLRQQALEQQLYDSAKSHAEESRRPARKAPRKKTLKEGELFGRLEIPRLNMSVMVMEGDKDNTLRLGAGHVPGTDMAIAGHRDTFFRPLKDIRKDDIIRFTTPDGASEYRVVSTRIVAPADTSVLDKASAARLTLITCYPFYYVGPAPQRFIVEALKN